MDKFSFSEFMFLVFVFAVGGGMTGLFGLFTDVALGSAGLSAGWILFLSHVVTGLVLCHLYWKKRVWETEWQHVLDDRLNKVILMNHYVRNSLQVLVNCDGEANGVERKAAVEQAGKRIEWALSHVLPCGWETDDRLPQPVKRQEELSPPLLPVPIPAAEPKAS